MITGCAATRFSILLRSFTLTPTSPRDQASLLDIAKAAQSALAFIDGLTIDDFTADIKTQSAVLYQIAVLGEAVKRLSPEFRSQHSTIDWRAIAGTRDKLISELPGNYHDD